MVVIADQDRFFSGEHSSSMPRNLIGEGAVSRLINSRFVDGAISNALNFSTLDIQLSSRIADKFVPDGNITYQELWNRGDVQLIAPLQNVDGKFLIVIIGGIIFQVDMDSLTAYDITPRDSFLPTGSLDIPWPLAYLDNSGGVYGSGGYLVIFNYPNRPIFINQNGARLSKRLNDEMPPARCGATGGSRAFVISGDNLMWASDPLGGASDLAPLTFEETYSGAYIGQIYSIGSALDMDYVTAVGRIPRLLGASQDFLAQNILVSTKTRKYIVAAGTPRNTWLNTQFITYMGTAEGIAGPMACTNIGSVLVYISSTGRIKTISQDTERNESLVETFFDDGLGMYLCINEPNYYFRRWYRELDHSRSCIKFSKDRLYATVYPVLHPSKSRFGEDTLTPCHRALAIGSIDPETTLGPQATIAWEGFRDWITPVGLALLDGRIYVANKDLYGRNSILKEEFLEVDPHLSTIITRGYFSGVDDKGKSISNISMLFRVITSTLKITVSALINNKWNIIGYCESDKELVRIVFKPKCKTDTASISLKIDIEHNGCRFELETIRVEGESYEQDR